MKDERGVLSNMTKEVLRRLQHQLEQHTRRRHLDGTILQHFLRLEVLVESFPVESANSKLSASMAI